MGEQRLGGLMTLHIHKEMTDAIDIVEVANTFVEKKQNRVLLFGKFTDRDLPKNLSLRNTGTQTD